MRILLVSGSTRAASTNTAALRTMHGLAVSNVSTELYDGLSELPAFNPDRDTEEPPPPVAALRAAIDGVDAVLFCTPEYAGSLPGSFKNLLDWTVKGGQLYEKPVASLAVGAPGRGDGAQANLGTVLGYVGAVPIEAASVRVTVSSGSVGPDGLVADPALRAQLADVLVAIRDAI
jgi:chromate reductase